MSTARRLRALRPTSTPRNRPPCGSSYSTRMCSMRMAFATLVLVIYQGLFIDVIARSLYATGSKSIGIATRQPLQSLPTCISIHHFLHPALPFYTLPSARAPRNTASLYCPSSERLQSLRARLQSTSIPGESTAPPASSSSKFNFL